MLLCCKKKAKNWTWETKQQASMLVCRLVASLRVLIFAVISLTQ